MAISEWWSHCWESDIIEGYVDHIEQEGENSLETWGKLHNG